jgi:hypothetical protein
VREIICTLLPWLALILALLGMRGLDPVIPISLLILIFLFWAINWLTHHISFRWLRYLRTLFWVAVAIAIIVVPELRALFEDVLTGLLSLESSTLIVLSLVTLIAWGVIGLSRPARQPHS